MSNKSIMVACLLASFAIADAGAGVPLPYHNPCDNLDGMTQDVGNQGRKWVAEDGSISIRPKNSSTAHDAYIWLPAIELSKGKMYRFAIDCKTLRSTPGTFELVMSDTPSRSGNVTKVRTTSSVVNWYTPFDCFYESTAAGEVYFGIHVTSPGAADVFYINEITVEEISARVPKSVTDLKVTPLPGGQKTATISFTSPNNMVGGGRGLAMTKIDMYCDGNLIQTFDSPQRNTPYSFDYSAASCGRHLFTVRPSTAEGEGGIEALVAHVGPELPDATYSYNGVKHKILAPVIYNDTTRKISFSWPPREGTAKANYDVYRMPDNVKVASNIADTTFTEQAPDITSPYAIYYNIDAVYPDSTKNYLTSTVISLHAARPFDLKFNSQEAVNECSAYDNGGTGWFSYTGGQHESAVTSANDDWLVSPGITLEAGKLYRVRTRTSNWSGRPAWFSLHAGRTNDYRGLGTELLPVTTVTSDDKIAPQTNTAYFTAPESGEYFFGVHAVNVSADVDPTFRLHGIEVIDMSSDIPSEITDAKPVYDRDNALKAKVVLTAPTKTLGGADLTEISKVELYKEGILVDTRMNPAPGSEVSFDVTLVSEKKDTYTVAAFNSHGSSPEASVTFMIIDPYYLNEFPTAESLDGYTLIDPGEDGFQWHWFNNQARWYPAPVNGPVTDWMITPAVHLEKGKYYRVSFVTDNEEQEQAQNQLSLSLGTEPTIEAMQTKIIDKYEPWGVGYYERALVKNYFTVPESGAYYLGFNNYADNGRYASPLYVDNFTISDKINGEVPDTITSYKIIPDPDGALKGNLKFNVPVKALNGTLLDKSKKLTLNVYINNQGYSILEGTPGQEMNVPVTVDSVGVWLMTVICNNQYGRGREAEQVAFFGINRPGNPYNVKCVENPDNYGEVTISWSPSAYDWDGFPMVQKHVSFEIVDLTGENENVIVRNLKDTTYTYQARTPNQPQAFMRFAVRARTSAGGSQGVMAPYISLGKPYALPQLESFPGCNPRMAMIQQRVSDDDGFSMWGFNTADPYDGVEPYDRDGGVAIMESIFAESSRRLFTGKIDLREAQHPVVALRVLRWKGKRQCLNRLAIQVGETTEQWDSVACKSIEEWADGEHTWQRIEVDLSKYKGKVVYLGIVGTSMSHSFTVFDALEVTEARQKNLGYVNFDTPETMNVGQTVPFTLRVKNHGHAKAENYTVNLYRNGEVIQSIEGEPLEPGEKRDFTFKDRLDTDARNTNTYYATITFDGDEETSDNRTANYGIDLLDTDFPGVSDLKGEQKTGQDIQLDWKAPQLYTEPQAITDDFESYDSWATMYKGVGKYHFNDLDGEPIAGIKGVTLPGIPLQSRQSWFVFDSTLESFKNVAGAQPHSGTKMMGCMGLYQGGYADDWLISPELSGRKQTISFWAKKFSPNYVDAFCLHWSSDGYTFRDMAQQETSTPLIGAKDEWTKYEFELPEGTKYFAIRRYAAGFMMFVDDLTYEPAGLERLSLEGYNIYYNGKQINGMTPVPGTMFKHIPEADGTHTYSVAAQYNLGQSPLSSVEVGFSGIAAPDADNATVTAGQGYILVAGAAGFHVSAFSADGICIHDADASADTLRIPAAPGVYAVRIADRTVKVLVY